MFLFLPIGIYYWWHVSAQSLTSWYDYLIAPIAALASAVLAIIVLIRLMSSKESRARSANARRAASELRKHSR